MTALRPATDRELAFLNSMLAPRKIPRSFLIRSTIIAAAAALLIAYLLKILLLGLVIAAVIIVFYAIAMKTETDESPRETELVVSEVTGVIEKVARKKSMVCGITISGKRYFILDGEPVSEGTKVRIAFIPGSYQIVSLERIYKEL